MPQINPDEWDNEHERRKRDKRQKKTQNNKKRIIERKGKINGKK